MYIAATPPILNYTSSNTHNELHKRMACSIAVIETRMYVVCMYVAGRAGCRLLHSKHVSYSNCSFVCFRSMVVLIDSRDSSFYAPYTSQHLANIISTTSVISDLHRFANPRFFGTTPKTFCLSVGSFNHHSGIEQHQGMSRGNEQADYDRK